MSASRHLRLRLRPIHRLLSAAVQVRRTANARLAQESPALCVTAEDADTLLAEASEALDGPGCGTDEELTEGEKARQRNLRRADGPALPLDVLGDHLGLSAFELQAVLLCAAPEIDPVYERVFAFLHDDLNCRHPTAGLLASLGSSSFEMTLERRRLLGRYGTLRRRGVLVPFGTSRTEHRQELVLPPTVFGFLIGAFPNVDVAVRPSREVSVPEIIFLPPGLPPGLPGELARALDSPWGRRIGLWGQPNAGVDELVYAVARKAASPLVRVACDASSAAESLGEAAAIGALAWLDTSALDDAPPDGSVPWLARAIADSPARVILTGRRPWRPEALIESGEFVDLELEPASGAERERLWIQALPELTTNETRDLASRYRFSGAELRAAAGMARSQARFLGNGTPAPLGPQLESACRSVTRRSGSRLATLVRPRRVREDLILPEPLFRQVLETAAFVRAGSTVYESWGLGRMLTGEGGLKALFTGAPGTGKTLAAEVIASDLGLPMLKVDISQIVSRWLGEGEKNLDAVFREAEESQAMLVFDDAEALFGKRGDVRHGSDRYANLEVGFLLQRLECFGGLAVLTSNLKDQIDDAFLRRFQIVLHFPSPGPAERLRLWQRVFDGRVPLESAFRLDSLVALDMTGAAIVSAATTAALLAASQGSPVVTRQNVVDAVERQFHRESRILSPAQLASLARP